MVGCVREVERVPGCSNNVSAGRCIANASDDRYHEVADAEASEREENEDRYADDFPSHAVAADCFAS
eukprot:33362-Rhodomonas_salina.2